MSDLDWLIDQFIYSCESLFQKKVFIAEAHENFEKDQPLNTDQLQLDSWGFEEATNKIEYIHWILKLFIPINFLGGYLNDI